MVIKITKNNEALVAIPWSKIVDTKQEVATVLLIHPSIHPHIIFLINIWAVEEPKHEEIKRKKLSIERKGMYCLKNAIRFVLIWKTQLKKIQK